MPGAFAHLTLVNIARETPRLGAVPGFPRAAISLLQRYSSYCELGAVSPDYPYLAVTHVGAKHWADKMHYDHTGDIVYAGVQRLRRMSGPAQQRGLAWLLGYTAHLTTDVTIHPVVERKVGPYEQNKLAHRVCEMNQDAYIFDRLDLGGIGLAEYLDSGIATCRHSSDASRLDEVITTLWTGMLRDVHEGEAARNSPDPDCWHIAFKFLVDKIAENGGWLVPLSRHTIGDTGTFYPHRKDVDRQYIDALEVPGGGRMSYDDIFDMAVRNVVDRWRAVACSVLEGSDECLASVGNWNLDTGVDASNRLVFWRTA
jgi:zinc dependent phospholipase C